MFSNSLTITPFITKPTAFSQLLQKENTSQRRETKKFVRGCCTFEQDNISVTVITTQGVCVCVCVCVCVRVLAQQVCQEAGRWFMFLLISRAQWEFFFLLRCLKRSYEVTNILKMNRKLFLLILCGVLEVFWQTHLLNIYIYPYQ